MTGNSVSAGNGPKVTAHFSKILAPAILNLAGAIFEVTAYRYSESSSLRRIYRCMTSYLDLCC